MEKYCPKCFTKYSGDETRCSADGRKLVSMVDRDLVGQELDERYKILSLLGRGGMGVVYVAEQAMIGRKVALKVLRREVVQDETTVKRFLTEAKAIASLRNPHTITLHDFGITDDGLLYYTMELLEGRPLSRIIATEGPLEHERAARLILQVVDSLEEAHEKGILHRDLKPDNLFVTVRRGEEVVTVLDFGIAKLAGDSSMESITRTGMICGTPAYLAPEQALGNPAVPASDLYSLGIVFYEMLAGMPPFHETTPMKLLLQHLNAKPTPINVRNPKVQVPASVDAFLLRALEKEPGARYATVAEFRQALVGALDVHRLHPATAPLAPLQATSDGLRSISRQPLGETAAFGETPVDLVWPGKGKQPPAEAEKGGPAHAEAEKGGPAHAEAEKGGPAQTVAEKGGPAHAVAEKGGPAHIVAEAFSFSPEPSSELRVSASAGRGRRTWIAAGVVVVACGGGLLVWQPWKAGGDAAAPGTATVEPGNGASGPGAPAEVTPAGAVGQEVGDEARARLDEATQARLDAEAKARAQEEARRQAEERAEASAAELAKLRAEAEEARKAAEEARMRADEAERRRGELEKQAADREGTMTEADEKARLAAETEAKVRAAEEARLKAEAEAKVQAAEEARLKAEAEAKVQAAEEARLKAEAEAKVQAAEEARLKAGAVAQEKARDADRKKADAAKNDGKTPAAQGGENGKEGGSTAGTGKKAPGGGQEGSGFGFRPVEVGKPVEGASESKEGGFGFRPVEVK